MAISRAALLKELLPGLNALFGLEYEAGWAVYYKGKRVTKVEPWDGDKHMWVKKKEKVIRPGIIHINEAIDELDAYMQAQKKLEQTT